MSLLEQTSDVWRHIYELYETAITAKAELQKDPRKRTVLLNLDRWYQQELPTVIKSRTEKYITLEELTKIMKWKLMRGKFRPRLQQMVEGNSTASVEDASKKAFKALPNLHDAITALVVLKAVGPATASAVLAAGAPQHTPFMADESMQGLGLHSLTYTLPAYMDYAQQVATLTKTLKKQDKDFGWSCHRVELALWTLQVAKMLKLTDILAFLSPGMTESATGPQDTRSPSSKVKHRLEPSQEKQSKKAKV